VVAGKKGVMGKGSETSGDQCKRHGAKHKRGCIQNSGSYSIAI
jgi:hypothetical protein